MQMSTFIGVLVFGLAILVSSTRACGWGSSSPSVPTDFIQEAESDDFSSQTAIDGNRGSMECNGEIELFLKNGARPR